MNEPWLIYGFVFVTAVMIIEAVYWMLYRARTTQKSINRRLTLGEKLPDRVRLLDELRRERGFADFDSPFLSRMNDYFVQTGATISKAALLSWTFGLSFVIFLATAFLLRLHTGSILIGLVFGLVLGPLLVFLYLVMQRSRRIARFAEQLPDAIDVIVRGLRVGHPFSTSIELVSREMADPVGTEFGITSDEIAFGQDVVTAVNNLNRRVGQEDLLFLVIAVTVQSQTGGNLAEVLARLSQLIRARVKLRLKVKALSAEGRMSARVLSSMPFLLFLVINTMSPNYFSEIRGSPAMVPALIVGGTLLAVGNFVIYRMVNFKI